MELCGTRATGTEVRRLESPAGDGRRRSVVGRWQAVRGERRERRPAGGVDAATGKPLGPDLPGHDANVTALAFAPDGRLFTASDDHTVRAWDTVPGKELLRGWTMGH